MNSFSIWSLKVAYLRKWKKTAESKLTTDHLKQLTISFQTSFLWALSLSEVFKWLLLTGFQEGKKRKCVTYRPACSSTGKKVGLS